MTGLDALTEAIADAEAATGATAFSAWMGVAASVGFANDRQSFLPDSMLRSILVHSLREADQAARGLDWADRDRFERERRELLASPKFRRAFEELMDYDPVMELSESPAYVGTITAAEGNAEERLERWLTGKGFRRNAIAYLKYRHRDGEREYEQSNWAYRREITGDTQLNLRLFDGSDPQTVDIYAHREPSIIKGQEHFGRPDYRNGVCETRQLLTAWADETDDITVKRVDELPTGETPHDYDCADIDPLPEA